jgi:hypothetical protein
MARQKIHRPNVFDDINFVLDSFQYSCHPEGPMVYIKTFGAAILPTLIAFNQFSCIDIIALRAGISWKCGKTVKAASRQGIAPWAKSATDFLYRMGPAFIRNVLWHYFIAEQITHFAARWTSLLYSNSGCDQPVAGAHTATATLAVFGLILPGTNRTITQLSGVGDECFHNTTEGYTVHAGCSVGVLLDLTYIPFHLDGRPTSITITIANSSGEVINQTTAQGDANFQSKSAFAYTPHSPGGILSDVGYEIRFECNGPGQAFATGGSVTYFSQGYKSEIVPAGCVPKSAGL